jgi:hypothetical protein
MLNFQSTRPSPQNTTPIWMQLDFLKAFQPFSLLQHPRTFFQLLFCLEALPSFSIFADPLKPQ